MRAGLERIARVVWPLAAGLLLGLAIGGVWTLLQPDRYHAEAHVLLRGASASRLAPAVEPLANGSVLEQNVRQTLRLAHRPDLSARVNESVVTMSADAGSPEQARQVDAEAVQVLTQLIAARFGSQGLQSTLLDPAHVVEQTSPTTGRNLLLCGLLGLVVGGGVAYARSRRRLPLATGGGIVDPGVERRLKRRIDEVTKRERALARRAGELAKSEAGLEQRRTKLEQSESLLKQRDAELGARERELGQRVGELDTAREELAARALAPPPPPSAPELAPVAAPAPPVSRVGSWNIAELQRAVDAQTGATPDQVENWRTYLYFIREHASPDGALPRSLDPLIGDVFAEILPVRAPS
jgi:hypothetical protein